MLFRSQEATVFDTLADLMHGESEVLRLAALRLLGLLLAAGGAALPPPAAPCPRAAHAMGGAPPSPHTYSALLDPPLRLPHLATPAPPIRRASRPASRTTGDAPALRKHGLWMRCLSTAGLRAGDPMTGRGRASHAPLRASAVAEHQMLAAGLTMRMCVCNGIRGRARERRMCVCNGIREIGRAHV